MAYTYEYPRPMVTVDILLISKENKKRELLCIQRKHNPFAGKWALPGGFVDVNEDLIHAAERELMEETNLNNIALYQFKTYGTPGRDPRGHTISVVYFAFINKNDFQPQAADDASDCKWFAEDNLPDFAFDHQTIVNDFFQAQV